MKNTLLVLISMITINTMAQKDTIYFNQHWEKVSKEKAKYYRLVPLKKIGNLYQIKDYFINGNIQMEGFWSDVKNEILEGETKWYFNDGTLAEIAHHKKGKYIGIRKTYTKNGQLKTVGTYKNNKPFNGTFPAKCSTCNVEELKNGKKIASYKYYKETNTIAQKTTEKPEGEEYEMFFYDKKGKQIGHVTLEGYEEEINGKRVYFNIDSYRQFTTVSNYAHFKNKVLEGEAVDYDKKGKIIAKGIYKEGKPATLTSPMTPLPKCSSAMFRSMLHTGP